MKSKKNVIVFLASSLNRHLTSCLNKTDLYDQFEIPGNWFFIDCERD